MTSQVVDRYIVYIGCQLCSVFITVINITAVIFCYFVTDLFEKVVPLAIQQALTMFENRRVELVNREIGRLREATQLMNRYIVEMWFVCV